MPYPSHHQAIALYAGTIFLSAFLLFSMQPLIARMALPLLGGTPAVWAVAMCVFQGLLLGGYAYAHVISARLSQRTVGIGHVLLLLAAAATLPITLRAGAAGPPSDAGPAWLVATLIASVGLPFFALSATAPLLQRWYSGIGAADSSDPYWLYLGSNAGSLVALAAYPLLIEPVITLQQQRTLWSFGFGVLLLAIAGAAALAARAGAQVAQLSSYPVWPAAPANITVHDRSLWIALAFVPSALLTSFTTFITTDLASAPLLWVIPLAIYLASFLVVFRANPPITMNSLRIVLTLAIAGLLISLEWNSRWSWVTSAAAGLAAYVAAVLIAHRVLYERRPPAAGLTDFYLCMALGGCLGGLFAALAAPKLFVDVVEFPPLLGAALAVATPGLWQRRANLRERLGWPALNVSQLSWLGAAVLASAVGVLAARQTAAGADLGVRGMAVLALGVAAAILVWRLPRPALACTLGALAAAIVLPLTHPALHTVRSFFGTHRVIATAGGRFHTLLHGTTLHGAEMRTDVDGRPIMSPVPLTYYHAAGPLAGGLAMARTAFDPTTPRLFQAGIVGLGAGAMACHARAAEIWRFYEIDPEVVKIARDARYFRYLPLCQPNADVVLGDARLTLAREPAGRFDYLLIDAFSSDAIPVHMLTREALALFLDRLTPRGVLVLHVSNQNLDLIPSIEATLALLPGIKAVYAEGQHGGGALPSQAVIIAREAGLLAPALAWHNARRLASADSRPWTDDYSNILAALWRKLTARRPAE